MNITLSEQIDSELDPWYSSKPKYPLHIKCITRTGFLGCITGLEQYFDEADICWRYQLTSIASGKPISSWWAEDDISEVISDAIQMELLEADQRISGCLLSDLEDVMKSVKLYGEQAIQRYHQSGEKRELRIYFWDALSLCLDSGA